MRVQVAGRQMELGDALKTRIQEELEHGVTKYFSSRPASAQVTVSRDGPFFEVDCALHLDSGMYLQAVGKGGDAHAAFSDALVKVEKRVRRYKRRLKNHQNLTKTSLSAEPATAYVLAAQPGEDDSFDADEAPPPAADDGAAAPLVIAETTVHLPVLTVSMAVLQLELSDTPCVLFKNAGNGALNLVYRRADGHVGWVDPQRVNGAA